MCVLNITTRSQTATKHHCVQMVRFTNSEQTNVTVTPTLKRLDQRNVLSTGKSLHLQRSEVFTKKTISPCTSSKSTAWVHFQSADTSPSCEAYTFKTMFTHLDVEGYPRAASCGTQLWRRVAGFNFLQNLREPAGRELLQGRTPTPDTQKHTYIDKRVILHILAFKMFFS